METNVTRENLSEFKGRENVTKIVHNDTGVINYLTGTSPFVGEVLRTGATKVDTYESDTKHVLFLYDANKLEVGKYYLTKALHGQTPHQIAEQKHLLCIFESWNPTAKEGKGDWIPCVCPAPLNQGPSEKAADL